MLLDGKAPRPVALLLALFPLIGLLLWGAVQGILRRLRHGCVGAIVCPGGVRSRGFS